MNILFHCMEYPPNWLPGAKRIRVFHDELVENGHQCKVLTSRSNLYPKYDEETKSADTIYCRNVPLKKKSSVYRLLNGLSFAVSGVLASGAAGKVDVVLTTSPPPLISVSGWMIAKLKGAKLIYDVRDIWPDVALEIGSFTEQSIYCKVFRHIANFMYLHADLITAVSPGKVTNIQSHLPLEQRSKVRLLENGLDETFLSQEVVAEVKDRYHLDGIFTIVYVGNIGLAQGLSHLLDLAETVDKSKYQFLLFGPGAEKDALEKSAVKRNLTNVHFEGVVDSKTVFSVLRAAQLAYIPLVNANLKDSIPTKTYEALGVGCPVLMVAEGDAPKLVEECRLGLTLSPNEMGRLPQVFERIISEYDSIIANKEYAQRMILENHSRQNIALELEKMLYELTDKVPEVSRELCQR